MTTTQTTTEWADWGLAAPPEREVTATWWRALAAVCATVIALAAVTAVVFFTSRAGASSVVAPAQRCTQVHTGSQAALDCGGALDGRTQS